jgi:K+-sensing histidine kinase KdpD
MPIDEARRCALAERSLVRITRRVQDLLDLALIHGGGLTLCRERTQLPDAMLAALECVRELAQHKHLALYLAPFHGAILLSGDPERLLRLLENLLSCVIEQTTIGGRVMIHTWSTQDHVALDIHGVAPGVMAEEYAVTRLHTPPETFESAPDLPFEVARQLVAAHGGCFAMQKVSTLGTAFCCLMPRQFDPTRPIRV